MVIRVVGAVSRTLQGLSPGATYQISFLQSGRTGVFTSTFSNANAGNDLRIAVQGRFVYSAVNILPLNNMDWRAKVTSRFIAPWYDPTLTLLASNPLGGDRAVFVDNVVVTKARCAGQQPPGRLEPACRLDTPVRATALPVRALIPPS